MKPSPKTVGGAVGIAVALFVATARAQPPSAPASRFPVTIILPRCVKAPAPAPQRSVSAELGIDVAMLEEDPAPAGEPAAGAARPTASNEDPNVTRVTISCTGQWLRLEVLDPVSGKTLVRHLDLSTHDPSTRTRMLGLSTAELIAASWIELTARPAARPHIVEAKGTPSARDTAVRAAQKALAQPSFYRIEAFASAQRTGSADLLTLGGGMGTSWVHDGWQVIGADMLVESG